MAATVENSCRGDLYPRLVPAVYFIASYDIIEAERYERDYVPAVDAAVRAVGGEVVVASGSARRLEGEAPGQTVVFRFPSKEAFDRWHDSAEYAPLHQMRQLTTTNGTAVLATEFQAPSRIQ